MHRPRISFVSPYLYPVLTGAPDVEFAGGAEVQQAQIIRALQGRGYPIDVVTGDFGQADVVHWNGIRIDKMRAPAGRGIKGLRFLHPRLTDCVSALRRQRPEIVYNRVASAYLAACAWYCRQSGARLVYAAASDADFRFGRNPDLSLADQWLFNLGMRRADQVLLQNRAQQQQLQSISGVPSVVLPNGYEEHQTRDAQFGGPVLFVGSIKRQKRPEHFISIAQTLPGRRFKMIGAAAQGTAGKEYACHIETLAREVPNLEYVGFVPFAEVGRHFDGAALLINTSETEGFPNTFLQAWTRGVPTVSYVAPETTPDKVGTIKATNFANLQTICEELLADESAWRMASAVCRTYFLEHHAMERVADLYNTVFGQL